MLKRPTGEAQRDKTQPRTLMMDERLIQGRAGAAWVTKPMEIYLNASVWVISCSSLLRDTLS